jgi:hypothetical protein
LDEDEDEDEDEGFTPPTWTGIRLLVRELAMGWILHLSDRGTGSLLQCHLRDRHSAILERQVQVDNPLKSDVYDFEAFEAPFQM